ncbi:MAG: glycosyltransferase family 1 protein [Candidimonas sp.]|nr:MAG: glycosyltransferase family 1 protein [Candidimonas sp.]TAM25020.1 MAG: glycosyltransferase family 1 protein [Candidimonas sp.]TAM73821.1 MAG: glycosyltransferase family 1 protein [Candidimonas sp.]
MTPLCILHSEAATSFGGQEQYIFRMMLAMRERGHYLEAVCQPHALLTERLRAEGFTVHTTFMDGPANYFRSIAGIREILAAGEFDVLNCHSRRDTVIAAAAGRLARTPLIVRTRHLANRVGSLLSYTVLPHRVIAASDFVRDHLVDRGVPPGHVATVYPAVELQEAPQQSTLRAELGLSPHDIVIGCVAVMRAQKGHRDLIDAVEPLIKRRANVHLVLVGGGSPVFEEIQAYSDSKNLQGRVHMLGARRDVPNLLAGFDIFALATQKEASGTVFVEAGAAGLPVVGTDVDGVPEMMQAGVSGFLVPLKDQTALTEAIEKLVDDPDLRRKMGQAGIQFCRNSGRFGSAAMVQRIESCYARWLAERRA